MIQVNPGTLLKSSATMNDTNFISTVVFICETDTEGAWGVVLNKQSPRVFNELVEFQSSIPFPLHIGGPMEQEKLFFIHSRPDIIDGGKRITDSIYWGGDFEEAVKYINLGILSENEVRFYLGYCGWDKSQLESEIEDGSWIPCSYSNESVFSNSIDTLWENIS
jgi:putative transcriptional regulator